MENPEWPYAAFTALDCPSIQAQPKPSASWPMRPKTPLTGPTCFGRACALDQLEPESGRHDLGDCISGQCTSSSAQFSAALTHTSSPSPSPSWWGSQRKQYFWVYAYDLSNASDSAIVPVVSSGIRTLRLLIFAPVIVPRCVLNCTLHIPLESHPLCRRTRHVAATCPAARPQSPCMPPPAHSIRAAASLQWSTARRAGCSPASLIAKASAA